MRRSYFGIKNDSVTDRLHLRRSDWGSERPQSPRVTQNNSGSRKRGRRGRDFGRSGSTTERETSHEKDIWKYEFSNRCETRGRGHSTRDESVSDRCGKGK